MLLLLVLKYNASAKAWDVYTSNLLPVCNILREKSAVEVTMNTSLLLQNLAQV